MTELDHGFPYGPGFDSAETTILPWSMPDGAHRPVRPSRDGYGVDDQLTSVIPYVDPHTATERLPGIAPYRVLEEVTIGSERYVVEKDIRTNHYYRDTLRPVERPNAATDEHRRLDSDWGPSSTTVPTSHSVPGDHEFHVTHRGGMIQLFAGGDPAAAAPYARAFADRYDPPPPQPYIPTTRQSRVLDEDMTGPLIDQPYQSSPTFEPRDTYPALAAAPAGTAQEVRPTDTPVHSITDHAIDDEYRYQQPANAVSYGNERTRSRVMDALGPRLGGIALWTGILLGTLTAADEIGRAIPVIRTNLFHSMPIVGLAVHERHYAPDYNPLCGIRDLLS